MARFHGLSRLSAVLLLLATTTAGVAQTQGPEASRGGQNEADAKSGVIYGQDDRRDYGHAQVTAGQRRAADATALVVFGRVQQFSKYVGRTTTFSMPARASFCSPQKMNELRSKGQLPPNYPDEPFHTDKVLNAQGTCTAFKVGPDLVATAGHCAGSKGATTACSNLNFVFNFHKSAKKLAPENAISGQDVYYCKEIVAREQSGRLDWAIVRVDREITAAPQVNIRTSTMPRLSVGRDELTLIGHPAGLPLKVAAGAKVRGLQQSFFLADLDAYGGNSGSPIFNSERLAQGELLVEGILQGGSNDYVDWCKNPSATGITSMPGDRCDCAVSYRCNFNAASAKSCGGEFGVYARFLEVALGGGGGGGGGAEATRTLKRP